MGEHKVSFGKTARLLMPDRTDIAVIILFGAVAGGLSLVVPVAVQSFVNNIAFTALTQPLVLLTSVVAAVLTISGFAKVSQSVAVEMLQRRIFVRLVARLGVGLPRVTPEAYSTWRASALSARFFEILTIQKVISTLLLDGVSTVLQTLLGMVLLAFYHPALLAFDIVLVAILAIIIVGLARGGVDTALAESKKKYAIHSQIDDLTRNPGLFRSPQTAEYARARLSEASELWVKARAGHFRVILRQHIGVVVLQAVASAALLAVGGTMVLKQQLSLGQLVAAEIVVTAVLAGASRFAKYLESYYDLVASSTKLGDVLALSVEPDRGGGTTPPVRPSGLDARNVRFSYPGAAKPIVRDFALSIAAGEHVAVLGDAGSGKSAIASILALQAQPEAGHVTIDGIDGREWQALRDRVVLLSRCELIGGTIIDNMRLGRSLPIEDVYAILRDVELLDAVAALPEGAHTQLGASDVPLSESECVRLCLARAIAQAPRLFIIDGLFDTLDPTEAKRLLAKLTAPSVSWTFVLMTRSRELAERVGTVVELDSAQEARSA